MKRRVNLFGRPALIFWTLLLFSAASGVHATQPPPPAESAAAEMQSLSGRGEYFEVILKFPTFAVGSDVALIAYVLDGVTNEPVRKATVSGGMSSGAKSITVPFTETDQPVAGAYRGKIRVESGETASWLFDISLGDKSDLVAIDGFKAGEASTGAGPAAQAPSADKPSGIDINLSRTEIGLLLAAFAALQAAVFFFIRKRRISGGSAKES